MRLTYSKNTWLRPPMQLRCFVRNLTLCAYGSNAEGEPWRSLWPKFAFTHSVILPMLLTAQDTIMTILSASVRYTVRYTAVSFVSS